MKKSLQKFFHRFFVPGHHNNHHAPVVSHSALTAYLVFAVASFVVFRNIGFQTGNVLGFATDVSVDRVYALTNNERSSDQLKALSFNTQLAAAAAAKAQDMFEKSYWAHFGPNGESPWNFILGTGYQYEYAGENLAKNYMTSSGVVEAWMKSPTHRDNILNNDYDEIGIAVVNGNLAGEDTTLVVQMFGSKSQIQEQSASSLEPVTYAGDILPIITPLIARPTIIQVRGGIIPTSTKTKPLGLQADAQGNTYAVSPDSGLRQKTPSFNLLPAFRLLSSFAIAFLITVFVIDLFHISKTQYHKHRGKHLAHIIFLMAILIGIYFLGRGAIL